MRTILIILRKEFLQIFRNRAMLPIIFVMPVVQLLLLSFAATFELRDTPFALVDNDRSATSRLIASRLEASGHFSMAAASPSSAHADDAMLGGRVGMILTVPAGLEHDLRTHGSGQIQLIFDAQDGAAAGVAQAYAAQILATVNRSIQVDYLERGAARPARIVSIPRHWYNPNLNYQTYMVPGILVVLVTMIGTFLSSMNVVREKEIGTIEQLNVTPILKYQFIVGKLLPFWIIALVELAIGLVVARIVFTVPMLGNLGLVFALAGVYLLVMLGFGLWISTFTETQQQAMFLAWFVLVVFILMSGLFTPIESMPEWAQRLTTLNPIAHFIEIMRRVLLKGAGFMDVQRPFWSLVAYAIVILTLAVRQHRKVTA